MGIEKNRKKIDLTEAEKTENENSAEGLEKQIAYWPYKFTGPLTSI